MIEQNVFWDIVKELYPLFLEICMVLGLYRLAKGIWQKLNGNEEGIGLALQDIIIAFFWLHMAIPIVSLIWTIFNNVSQQAENVIKLIE